MRHIPPIVFQLLNFFNRIRKLSTISTWIGARRLANGTGLEFRAASGICRFWRFRENPRPNSDGSLNEELFTTAYLFRRQWQRCSRGADLYKCGLPKLKKITFGYNYKKTKSVILRCSKLVVVIPTAPFEC